MRVGAGRNDVCAHAKTFLYQAKRTKEQCDDEQEDEQDDKRKQLIVESGDKRTYSDTPIPPPKFIANSTMTTGNNTSTDTSRDGEGAMEGKERL